MTPFRSRLVVTVILVGLMPGMATCRPRPESKTARAEQLLVVASAPSAFEAARRKPTLESQIGLPVQIVASSDCSNLKPNLYLIAVSNGTRQLASVRDRVPDAYVRACNLRGQSVIKTKLDAIDPSFAEVREEPVNWSSPDTVAKIAGRTLRKELIILRPYHVLALEDPREGLRNAIDILQPENPNLFRLVADCTYPHLSLDGDMLAVACAKSSVAEQPLYQTKVFNLVDRKLVRTIEKCAAPKISAHPRMVSCEIQIIGKDGVLSSRSQDMRF